MLRLDRLRLLARYNVLTPFAVLAAAALAQPTLAATVIINAPVIGGVGIPDGDSLVNNSDISASGDAVSAAGSVGTITNASGASIESTAGHAVVVGGAITAFTNEAGADIWGDLHGVYFVAGNVDTFTNAGSILGNTESAVSVFSAGSFVNSGDIVGNAGVDFGSTVDSFRNEAGGLIDGTTSFGVSLGGPVGDFYNAGTITGSAGAVAWNDVTSFTNDQTGVIKATAGLGIEFYGVVTSFSNLGLIESPNFTGVFFDTDVGSFANAGTITGTTGVKIGGIIDSFRNEAGGLITGSSDQYAVNFLSPVGDFYNAGTILGGSDSALGFDYASASVDSFTNAGIISAVNGITFGDHVDTFRNEAGALIEGTGDEAVSFDMSVGALYNAGTIAGASKGVYVDSTIGSFLNDAGGVISAWESFGEGVIVYGEVGTFTNRGQIEGGGSGVYFDEHVQTFTNAGAISGNDVGVDFNADVANFTNAAGGNIRSLAGIGVRGGLGSSVLENAGTISGQTGIQFNAGQSGDGHVINSGTIEGTGGVAIDFGFGGLQLRDDRLTILTGSRIIGDVDFGAGDDAFDFSGFRGNALLAVAGLETVEAGAMNYVWDQPNEQIAIFDMTGTTSVGSSTADVAGSINGVIGSQFGDGRGGGAGPLNYAPARQQTSAELATESAVLSRLDVGETGSKAWATIFTGGSSDSAPVALSNVYGGLVAGAHARLLDNTDIGLLGGYVRGSYDMSSGQVVATDTGLLGLYGRTEIGVVELGFSLLGGLNGHQSSRELVALGVTETATASFGSWFLAPTVGVELPVLAGQAGDLSVVASAGYVGGSVDGYTETGSSMNLTVGSQTIGSFDARLGVAGRIVLATTEAGDISLGGRAGFFAQANLGSSTVPVTAIGQTISVTTAGGSGHGVFAGIGIDAPITENIGIDAGLDVSLRSDGLVAGAAKASIEGSF